MRFGFALTLFAAMSHLSLPVFGQYAPLMEDNTAMLDVPGRSGVNSTSWTDSYSIGNSCYCQTSFDHNIGDKIVTTPLGQVTVREVCELLGDGPGGSAGRPLYNDIQCGNGPPNDAGDEGDCPGRVEYGKTGCKYIGPKWNFDDFLKASTVPTVPPTVPPTMPPAKLRSILCGFIPRVSAVLFRCK